MVDVKHYMCIKCYDKKAIYTDEGKKPKYCNLCKENDMIDVYHIKCKGQKGNCTVQGNKKYDGYCTFCFQHEFPNDPRVKNINKKTKEIKVKTFLEEEYKDMFIHDKPLWTGNCDCSHRRRVDFRVLINETILAIEVDENMHRDYDEDDENIRYNDLYMIHSGKWIFIRFNPDKYKNEKGETKDPRLNTRLKRLKEEIDNQIERIEQGKNDDPLEIIKLFYV
jgi:hypothetical protein